MPKPKFTLTDTSGTPFDFWSETQRYVTLLFFGYTHCPETAHTHQDYRVSHAAFVLAYTKDNLAHVIYPGGVTPEDWSQDLPLLVEEAWSSREDP